MLNRGVERAAQRRGFDLLLRSVDITDHEAGRRVLAVARKSDGLILHDGLLEPGQIDEISRHVPIVTLAGIPSPRTANVGSDNVAGMRALARHLLHDHGYTTLGYLSAATATARTARPGCRPWPPRPRRRARSCTRARSGRATTTPRARRW